MIQGTGSHVGKSVMVAALCRILVQDGYNAAPFKAQNMALNSFVTWEGGEIGRAQAVQAAGARIIPETDMNPVLLKPFSDKASQVIVHGQPVGNMDAYSYHHDYVNLVWPAIVSSFQRLSSKHEIIVLEGAGSPAEINLQDRDVVNMRAAHMANAPVLLVVDIDKGGAFASIIGTLELLKPEDRKLVAGIIINKFRGDYKLLEPALDFIQQRTGIPVLGVIPFFNFKIPEEDSVNKEKGFSSSNNYDLDISILYLPHISNFTDFDPLEEEPDVRVRYVYPGEKIGQTDLLLIPGSKNTIGDLSSIRKLGWEEEILHLAKRSIPIIGICGGFQMLGKNILDPEAVESENKKALGLGLIDMVTRFSQKKLTYQVEGKVVGGGKLLGPLRGLKIAGYEIHMGESFNNAGVQSVFQLFKENCSVMDGACSENGLILGTYLHGLFDRDEFRRGILNQLRKLKGLPPLPIQFSFQNNREVAYNNLARLVRDNLNMQEIYKLLKLNP